MFGVVLDTHGLKGNLKIKKIAKDLEDDLLFSDVYVKVQCFDSSKKNEYQKIRLKKLHKHKDLLVVNIDQIESISDVQKYIKQKIYIKKSDLQLENDEFFIDDLIGMHVQNNEKEIIGIVHNVCNFGASDIIEIKTSKGDVFMKVFSKENFTEINKKEGKIVMQN